MTPRSPAARARAVVRSWLALGLALSLGACAHHGARGSHETRSCLSVADEETDGLTEFYEDGPPVERSVWGAFESEIEEALVVSSSHSNCGRNSSSGHEK